MIRRIFNREPLNWRYAVGEVALIVVGILIAMAIGTLQEEIRENWIERKYLRALLDDISTDLETLKVTQAAVQKLQIEPLSYALKTMNNQEGDDFDQEKFVSAIARYGDTQYFTPKIGTYQDLTSSGQIHLINDFSLRNKLSDYYNAAKYNDFYYEYFRDVLANSNHEYFKHVDLLWSKERVETYMQGLGIQVEPVDPATLQALKSSNLKDFMAFGIMAGRWMQGSLQEMIVKAEELQTLLKEMI